MTIEAQQILKQVPDSHCTFMLHHQPFKLHTRALNIHVPLHGTNTLWYHAATHRCHGSNAFKVISAKEDKMNRNREIESHLSTEFLPKCHFSRHQLTEPFLKRGFRGFITKEMFFGSINYLFMNFKSRTRQLFIMLQYVLPFCK